MEKACKQCGKVFVSSKSRAKYGRGLYCSKACQYIGIQREQTRTCLVCETPFTVQKSSTKRFCSPACAYQGRSLGLVKRVVTKPYRNAGIVSDWRKRQCVVCKTPFIAHKRTQTHCSKDCARVTQSKRNSGERNYFYKNGKTKEKRSYRGDDWGQIRKQVYKRDKWCCRFCGKHCERKEIQCHHIIPYSKGKDNSMGNLVTLCIVCHPKIERNTKKYNAEFFANHIPKRLHAPLQIQLLPGV